MQKTHLNSNRHRDVPCCESAAERGELEEGTKKPDDGQYKIQ
jgi:hypothetical protein